MKILILTAGDETRWNNYLDTPKCLAPILGESLVGRTVRLLAELAPDADVRIVTKNPKDPAYKFENTKRVGAKLNPGNGDIDKFVSSLHAWDPKQDLAILMGDVWWSKEVLTRVLEVPGTFQAVGRYVPDGGEIFGFTINREYQSRPKEIINALAPLSPDYRGGWALYRALEGLDLNDHSVDHRFVDVVETYGDVWTEDFDGPEDWDNWCYRYAVAEVKPE